MSCINEIAYYLQRRDEVPNQELAKKLADEENKEGLAEIANFLSDKNPSIASDCIKVIYETGYINPKLIAPFANKMLDLLSSKHNRMVWGAMIALSTIAELESKTIWQQRDKVLDTIQKGTVITQVSGIRVLVGLAKANKEYKKRLLPVLFEYLETCRPVDFATRTETLLPIIQTDEEKEVIQKIIQIKEGELTEAQKKKLNKSKKKLLC